MRWCLFLMLGLTSCTMSLHPVKIKLLPVLPEMDTLIAQAQTHTQDCGTTKTGVWILAWDGVSCPDMADLDRQTAAAAKLANLDPVFQADSTMILYGHYFMCDDVTAIGCTTAGKVMIVDIKEGWHVFRHELLHAMLFDEGTLHPDGDHDHLDCARWARVDPDMPDCFKPLPRIE